MMIPEKMTLRLGDLRQPLEDWCNKHNVSPSEAMRTALASMLGVEPPAMDGNLANLKQYAIPKAKRKVRRRPLG
jgi:hypothetical protein